MKFDKRLDRIQTSLREKGANIHDMSDDELARIITGDPSTSAGDITDEYLEFVSARSPK